MLSPSTERSSVSFLQASSRTLYINLRKKQHYLKWNEIIRMKESRRISSSYLLSPSRVIMNSFVFALQFVLSNFKQSSTSSGGSRSFNRIGFINFAIVVGFGKRNHHSSRTLQLWGWGGGWIIEEWVLWRAVVVGATSTRHGHATHPFPISILLGSFFHLDNSFLIKSTFSTAKFTLPRFPKIIFIITSTRINYS